jgi:phospholipid/cholesterol/gamma-HCH transport system substrate-binding protein
VRYENVTGLSRGAPVTFEGFQIGRVSEVKPSHVDGVTSYLVELEVDDTDNGSWPIPDDSRFLLISTGLLSTVTVDIERGDSKSFLDPNSDHIVQGAKKGDIMETIGSIASEIELYKEEFRDIIKLIKDGAKTLDKGVADIVSNVSSLTNQMQDSIQNVKKILSDSNSRSITNIITSVEQGAANFKSISKQLKGSQKRLDQMLEESRQVVAENRPGVRQSVSDLQASIQILSRHIGAITHNLDLMSRDMAEFSRQIRENPGVLLLEPTPREAAP